MINLILKSISVALNAEFNEKEYEIYIEQIKQDLKEPCFFIVCLNPTNKLFLGKRYFRKNQFCIHYFPENNSKANEECHAIASRLFLCLEQLAVKNDLVRGTQMSYEIIDGVLHFFVNYDMFVYKQSNVLPTMEEMEEEVSVKGR